MLKNIFSTNLRSAIFRSNLRMASNNYDLVVIGSGPGGYVAAIKAAQLGLKTACVEKDKTFGGTCLNVGCIPSKALLHSSHVYKQVASNEFKTFGVELGKVSLNLEKLLENKNKVVETLTGGVSYLLKKNKIDSFRGFGSVKNAREVLVTAEDRSETVLTAKNILLASGSTIIDLPGVEIDEKQILSSTGALSLEKVPENMVVIGAGVIGLELGSVWSRLGCKVQVVEVMGNVGGADIDAEVSSALQSSLKKQGIGFMLNTKVTSVKKRGPSLIEVTMTTTQGSPKTQEVICDALLVCVGRKPFTTGLGVAEAGVALDEKGRIKVGKHYETSLPGVFAIGDCITGPMLAHKAEDEGMACVEWIANGTDTHIDYNAIPSVIYTHPEVAWVGQSEQTVKASGRPYKIGSFPMKANSRARASGESDGFVKVVVDKETDRLLGVHMISSVAGELINEATLALEYGASSEDLARTCHAHPTVAEALREACHMAAFGKPINF